MSSHNVADVSSTVEGCFHVGKATLVECKKDA